MKILLFLLPIIGASFVCHSQMNTYHPYPTGWGASWTVQSHNWVNEPLPTYTYLEWYKTDEINSETFHDVYRNGTLIGKVRQNASLEEAIYIDSQNNEFNIAINQNAVIGDTILFEPEAFTFLTYGGFSTYSDTLIITQIDSVQILGEYRKKYTLVTPDQFYFIDADFIVGIGFIGFHMFEYIYYLECHKNESNLLITSGNPLCELGVNELTPSDFEIIPNPTTSFVEIKTEQIGYELKIVDYTGKHVSESTYLLNDGKVDITKLPQGVYLFEFRVKDSVVLKRVIKQ